MVRTGYGRGGDPRDLVVGIKICRGKGALDFLDANVSQMTRTVPDCPKHEARIDCHNYAQEDVGTTGEQEVVKDFRN